MFNAAPSKPASATVAEVAPQGAIEYQKEREQIEINQSPDNQIMTEDELPLPFEIEEAEPEAPVDSVESDSLALPEGVEEPAKPQNVPDQFTDQNYVAQLKQTKDLLASTEGERLESQKKKKIGELFSPQGNTSLVGMALSGVWDAVFSKMEEEHFVEDPEERRGIFDGVLEDAKAGFFGQDIHPERGDSTKNRLNFLFKPFEVVTAAIAAPFSDTSAQVQRNQQKAQSAILNAVRTGKAIDPDFAASLNMSEEELKKSAGPELARVLNMTDAELAEMNISDENLEKVNSHPLVKFLDAMDKAEAAVTEKVESGYGDPNINFGEAVMTEQAPNIPAGAQKAGGAIINMLTDPTTLAGLFSIKVAQLGMKRAKDVNPGASYTGLMQEGVTQLADDIKRITAIEPDPTKFSELGELAAKADAGDVEALTQLNVKLSQIPKVAEHIKQLDVETVAKQNKEIDSVLGSPNSPAFTINSTEQGDQLDINLSSFNDDTDIDNLIEAFAKRSEADVKRYGVDEAKYVELSQAAAVDIADIVGKPAKDFSPSEVIAYKQALQTTATQLGKLAKKADASDATPLQQAAYEKTLGIFSVLANKATDAKMQQAQLRDIYKVAEKGGVKRIRETMTLVEGVKMDGYTNAALRKALAEQTDPMALAKTAAATSRLEKLPGAYMEILTNATISSLDTQATNIKSNLGTALMMPVQTYTQSLSALARADLKQAQIHAKDGMAQLSGLSEGVSDVLKMSFTKSTWDSQGLPMELRKTSEMARQEIKHKVSSDHLELSGPLGVLTDVTGKYVRVPGAALLVADRGFKTLNYRMQTHSTAMKMAQAATDNPEDAYQIYKTLKNNPTDEMIVQGIDIAEQNTFTSSLGNGLAGQAQKTLAKAPFAQPWFMFFKTTTNIFKRGLKDSAPGVIKQHGMHVLEKSARGDVARARLTLGFAAPTAIVASMDNMDIVGRLDYKDPHDRFMIDQGVPEYSIRTGTDDNGKPTYFQYGKFEPLRAVLGLAANYKQAMNMYRQVDPETGQENPVAEELFKAVAAPFVHTYTDNYMVENVGGAMGLLDAVNTGKEDLLAKELERLTTSVVFNNFASNLNNKYVDGNYRYADDTVSRIKNRLFILSQENGSQVTAWGDSRIRPRNVGVDYLSSTVSLGQAFDEFDEEVVNKGVMLEEPPKKIDAGDGIMLKLSGHQRTMFGTLRGKGIPGEDPKGLGGELKPQFIDIMTSDDYLTKLSDKERRQVLQDFWTNRTAAVKAYMRKTDPELQAQYEEKLMLLQMQTEKSRQAPANFGDRP